MGCGAWGGQEIDELFKIFRVLGTPSEETWPGVGALPDYKDAFPQWAPRPLAEVVPALDTLGLDILRQMLQCAAGAAAPCPPPGPPQGLHTSSMRHSSLVSSPATHCEGADRGSRTGAAATLRCCSCRPLLLSAAGAAVVNPPHHLIRTSLNSCCWICPRLNCRHQSTEQQCRGLTMGSA